MSDVSRRSSDMVTVVMTQRERFSLTGFALKNLYRTIPSEVRVIFVDGGSGPESQALLEQYAERFPRFEVIRREYFLTQHEAFNLAAEVIETPYIAYVDNDTDFHPDWLDVLLATAHECNAAITAPLYLEQFGSERVIHMAGGELYLRPSAKGWLYEEKHLCAHRPVEEVENLPECEETDLMEYHAFLIERQFLCEMGGFDTGFYNAKDHADLSLIAKGMNRKVMMNRTVWVSYQYPPPVRREDVDYFLTRWSQDWTERSYHHFERKWGITAPLSEFFGQHRRNYYFTQFLPLQKLFGFRNARRIYYRLIDPLLKPFETARNRKFMAAHDRLPPHSMQAPAETYSEGAPAPLERVFRMPSSST